MKKRFSKVLATISAIAAVLALFAIPAACDDTSAGREIASKWSDAIVRVQIVLKARMSVEGRETGNDEHKSEGTGTVIDPSGLTLIPLFATNPAEAFGLSDSDEDGYSMKTEVSDVKIRLSDGREIPAMVVLRDNDLGIALIRPKQKQDKPFTAVNLDDSCQLQVLDSVLVLSRLGKVANRSVSVKLDRVQAVVDKPRKFYVTGLSDDSETMGGPAFGLDGKLAGIVLLRTSPGEKRSFDSESYIPVVLPCPDISEVAKQAPTEPLKEEVAPEPAKAPEKPAAKPAAKPTAPTKTAPVKKK